MRVEFLRLTKDAAPEVAGEATLDDDGQVVFGPGLEKVARRVVVKPGQPDHRLVPEDGEEYLRALPFNWRGTYFWAQVVEDDEGGDPPT